MSTRAGHQRVAELLQSLHGADPFAAVREASNKHREEHATALLASGAAATQAQAEQICGVYPSDHLKMRIVTTVARAAGAKRVLEIGAALGYSALWLADAMAPDGTVETIDSFPEHAELGQRYAEDLGYDGRVRYLVGDGAAVLASLSGPYDLVHDDGWFAEEPAHFERMIELTRPGGLIVMSNWFLLQHAVTGDSDVDWSAFAGPDWARQVRAYAERLVSHPRLYVSFLMNPAFVALAYRR